MVRKRLQKETAEEDEEDGEKQGNKKKNKQSKDFVSGLIFLFIYLLPFFNNHKCQLALK